MAIYKSLLARLIRMYPTAVLLSSSCPFRSTSIRRLFALLSVYRSVSMAGTGPTHHRGTKVDQKHKSRTTSNHFKSTRMASTPSPAAPPNLSRKVIFIFLFTLGPPKLIFSPCIFVYIHTVSIRRVKKKRSRVQVTIPVA
jgi:hypothetical protein